MMEKNIYEIVSVSVIFIAIMVLVFVAQIILIFKFRNINQSKLKEYDDRLAESEKLVRSQVAVNSEVIKMINGVNELISKSEVHQ